MFTKTYDTVHEAVAPGTARYSPLWFWGGLVLVVVLAAVSRLLVYDYGLPYLEYIDEVQLYWYGQTARGLEALNRMSAIYPPGIVQIHVVVQTLLELAGQQGPAVTIQTLRLLAVMANLVGVVFLVLAVRLWLGDAAGLVAGAAWAVAPEVVNWSVLAIGESFVYPLLAVSLFFAVGAWLRPERWRWALVSIILALMITLFEYRLIVVLVPGTSVLVWRIGQRYGAGRRAWAGMLLLTGCVLAAGWLALVLLLPPRYSRWAIQVLVQDLWDIPLLLDHLWRTVEMLYWPGILAFALLGLLGLWKTRRTADIRLVLLFVALVVLINWLAAAVRWDDDQGVRIQNVLPASLIVCLLAGAGTGLFLRAFRNYRLVPVVVSGALIWLGAAQLPPLAALVQEREVQNWQVIIRQWADANLTPGTVIVYNPHERTFNPFWGGIQGRQWFDWWPTEDILEYPLQEWIEQRGMSYALIPVAHYQALAETAEGQALLSEMLPLRAFVHPPARREAEGHFFRLWRMQHETEVHFGDHIVLTGYDQSAETVQPGESVSLTFYWNAPTPPEDNYSLFVHLVPQDEYQVLAQADGAPVVPERPTLTWTEPGETLISPAFNLIIPPDLEPGRYRLMIGLYNFRTGQRLPVAEAEGRAVDDAYQLAELRVTS